MQSFDIKHIYHKLFYAIQVWPYALFNTFIKVGSVLLVIACTLCFCTFVGVHVQS